MSNRRKPPMSYKGMRMLYLGDFNALSAEVISDTLRRITFTDREGKRSYTILVEGLYDQDEAVLEYEEQNLKISDHVLERQLEAKRREEE